MADSRSRNIIRSGYRKVVFKLSTRQRSMLERCARYENTTPTKFIKQAISLKMEPHLERIALEDANPVSENQLELFDFTIIGSQISMWEADL